MCVARQPITQALVKAPWIRSGLPVSNRPTSRFKPASVTWGSHWNSNSNKLLDDNIAEPPQEATHGDTAIGTSQNRMHGNTEQLAPSAVRPRCASRIDVARRVRIAGMASDWRGDSINIAPLSGHCQGLDSVAAGPLTTRCRSPRRNAVLRTGVRRRPQPSEFSAIPHSEDRTSQREGMVTMDKPRFDRLDLNRRNGWSFDSI